MFKLTNGEVSNARETPNLNDLFKHGTLVGMENTNRGKKRKLDDVDEGILNSTKKTKLNQTVERKFKNPHFITVDNIRLCDKNQLKNTQDEWDYKNMLSPNPKAFSYDSHEKYNIDGVSKRGFNNEKQKLKYDEEGDDDVNFDDRVDINLRKDDDGDNDDNDDDDKKSEVDEPKEVVKPIEDPVNLKIDNKTVTEMDWMPHSIHYLEKKPLLSEYELINEMNRKKIDGSESDDDDNDDDDDDDDDDAEAEDNRNIIVSNSSILLEDIEAKKMDIENFGNLGQFKLLDGQTVFDDIKRALINCNHGMDEFRYCKLIADKFNDSIARPYNESRELKLKMINSKRNMNDTSKLAREKGQQKIDTYFVKGAVNYWTTDKVYQYRKSTVCPIKDYLDMAMGFRDIHKALRDSVVYEHRNEVYPNGKPVIKAEEKIWKVVKEAADMYFKFMNAKPQDSIYANATRKVLTGVNDIFDASESVQRKPMGHNYGSKQSNVKGSRRGGVNKPQGLAYDHPALERVKNRKSVGAIPKVGGYNVNAQVNQFDF